MLVLTKAEGIYRDVSDRYKRGGEIALVTKPVEIEGRRYREIVYNKTFFGKMTRNLQGVIYIDENGEIITDKKLQKQIAWISYYAQTIFDESYLERVKSAVIPEKNIEKEEADYNVVVSGLEILKSQGLQGTDEVSRIILKLPQLKRENNKALEEFIQRINKFDNNEDIVLSKGFIQEILSYYRGTLIKNFERIKHINTGRNYYDSLKQEVSKKKRQLKTRVMDRYGSQVLGKVEYTISHLKKVLVVYDAIVDLSQKEYMNYLDKMDEAKINNRLEKIRQ